MFSPSELRSQQQVFYVHYDLRTTFIPNTANSTASGHHLRGTVGGQSSRTRPPKSAPARWPHLSGLSGQRRASANTVDTHSTFHRDVTVHT